MKNERDYVYVKVKNTVISESYETIRYERKFENYSIIEKIIYEIKLKLFDKFGNLNDVNSIVIEMYFVKFGLRIVDGEYVLGIFRPYDNVYVFDEDMNWAMVNIARSTYISYKLDNKSSDTRISCYDGVIVEDGVLESGCFYITRVTRKIKCNKRVIWYIGSLEDTNRKKSQRINRNRKQIHLYDIIETNPYIADIFNLPKGSYAVIKDKKVVSLIDRNGNERINDYYNLDAFHAKYIIHLWSIDKETLFKLILPDKTLRLYNKTVLIFGDVFGGVFIEEKDKSVSYINPVTVSKVKLGIDRDELFRITLNGGLEEIYKSAYSKSMLEQAEKIYFGSVITTIPMVWVEGDDLEYRKLKVMKFSEFHSIFHNVKMDNV